MKRFLYTLSLLFAFAGAMNAQQTIVIQLQDTILKFQTWELDNITFEAADSVAVPAVAQTVDLGLQSGILWADRNFGAADATQPGYDIGWGDVTGKNLSSNVNYFPAKDWKQPIVVSSFDIVNRYWGGDWRMPTDLEIQELIEQCDWTYDDATKCFIVTSKANGNKLSLPLAGVRNIKTGAYVQDYTDIDTKGYYWTGFPSETAADKAKALTFTSDVTTIGMEDIIRYYGCQVRPVFGKYMYGCTVKSDEVTNTGKSSFSVKVQYAGNFGSEKISEFGLQWAATAEGLDSETCQRVTLTSCDEDGTAIFTVEGLEPNTTYYYRPYVVYDGYTNLGAVKSLATKTEFPVAEAVDLGLSVKWASFNMGAEKETDSGVYVGWGDPTGKNTSFINTDYPNDYADITGTKYDIATKMWGEGWRMPTPEEMQELDQLEKHEVKRDGVVGIEVTGKNGYKIFIPCAGYEVRPGGTWSYENMFAFYWTSKNNTLDYAYAIQIGLVSSTLNNSFGKGRCHLPVRPVYGKKGGEPEPPVVPTRELTALGKKVTAVDLGLPSGTKWAPYNLGTTDQYKSGDYFAWGETAPKEVYSKSNYKLYNAAEDAFVDIKCIADIEEYDAAAKLWGGTWNVPTAEQAQELIDNCTWTWSVDKKGYYVKSKINGKQIFLMAAGRKYDSYSAGYESFGQYMTADYNSDYLHRNDNWIYVLEINENHTWAYEGADKFYGFTIRPVCK